jgi:hypothetical protein
MTTFDKNLKNLRELSLKVKVLGGLAVGEAFRWEAPGINYSGLPGRRELYKLRRRRPQG